ncbi:MAG: type II secretion system protein GspG, partial [Verrucomicrobiales bacterium]|nr:type II secretion system protein GspG [Verrucomicrobiales bacterium]
MKLKFNSRKSRKGAFTLIEILLVLVIIGLVATVLVVNIMPQQAGAERDAAELMVKSVKNSLDTYRLNIGHYPTEEEGGLLAL